MVSRLYKSRRHKSRKNSKDDNHDDDNDIEDKKDKSKDEDDFECCEECSKSFKNDRIKVTYRPLVNSNGAFLCDACYKSKFPATAMCDESLNENVFSKLKDAVTKKNNNNDHNHNNKIFPEEEECCSCLEHGIYRRCCEKYYCRKCYFNPNNACPGCKTPIHRTGVTQGAAGSKIKPSQMAVLASWGISISVYLVIILFLFTTIANWSTKPVTVWGHSCHGWFPQCTEPVCIDFGPETGTETETETDATTTTSNNDGVAVTGMNMNMNIPSEYKYCAIDRTINKIVGNACIFDPELYKWSSRRLGFDICTRIDTKSRHNGTDISYENGVYVFEDNFDYWSNATNYSSESIVMKSARWNSMENAMASDICGFNNITRPYEYEQQKQRQYVYEYSYSHDQNDISPLTRRNASLVFTGVRARFAETVDLDVLHGGRVEFYIKLAPIVPNELATPCKTAFNGDVQLSFSTDGGASYVPVRMYPVWKYRHDHFKLVREDIPIEAQTSSTRFRWDQIVFDPQRDYWALDDVRVFHEWPIPSYKQDKDRKMERNKHVGREQCCYDTEQCDAFPNRRQDCSSGGKYDYSSMHERLQRYGSFRFKAVDIYVTIAAIVLVMRKGFQDFYQWTVAYKVKEMNRRENINKQQDISMTDEHQGSPSCKKDFQLDISQTWQRFAMLTIGLPQCTVMVLLIIHLTVSWDFYSTSTFSFMYVFVPFSMDFWVVRRLGLDVFHYWPFHIPPQAQIDASDEKELLIIGNDYDGDEIIPLLDLRNVEVYSAQFYVVIFISIWFSSLPVATMSVLIKAIASHGTYVPLLHILGVSSILRSILGPLWFVELILSIKWLSSISVTSRDDMGRACSRPSMRYIVTTSTICSVFVLLPIILQQFWDDLNASWVIGLIFSSLALGILVGSTVGMLRGLGVVPRISLICWPDDGYCFTSDRNSKDADILSKLFSGGMTSAALYLLPLQQMDTFRVILSGTLSLEEVIAAEEKNKTIKESTPDSLFLDNETQSVQVQEMMKSV